MFTRSSVHCADRIVATRHSKGFVKLRATCASGYAFESRLMISGARSSIGLVRVSAVFGVTAHTLRRVGGDAHTAVVHFTSGSLIPVPPFDLGRSLRFLEGFSPTEGERALASGSVRKATRVEVERCCSRSG